MRSERISFQRIQAAGDLGASVAYAVVRNEGYQHG